ncbi:MAG: Tim44 domain-containing protein [Magnetococcales bacterium]|nr:Tim44 domain-containing protein [Magnetococcales bacterium]
MNKTRRYFAMFAIALTLGFAALTVMPNDAEARRFGGGKSFGSRGSRSFSVPRQAQPRSAARVPRSNTQKQSNLGATGRGSGFGSGLMGGIGGMLLGGMIGSMLFGGGGGVGGAGAAGGGGIGFLEILLIGGGIWFFMRWYKRKKTAQASGNNSSMGSISQESPMDFTSIGSQGGVSGGSQGGLPDSFETEYDDYQPQQSQDEVSQGLDYIMQTDPSFREDQFLDGAKMAYKQIQGAWSDWSVDRLKPIMTERMWLMVEKQAEERKEAGIRDIIEQIQFKTVEISEAWQESGENWISVHFVVGMLEYSTDVEGKLLEGSTDTPVEVVEYWTFTRPVGAQDPNWYLAAVQQSDEVARSTS